VVLRKKMEDIVVLALKKFKKHCSKRIASNFDKSLKSTLRRLIGQ